MPAHAGDRALVITFVADAGRLMLEWSPSVSEVIDRLRTLLPAVGPDGASVDATFNDLTLSCWDTFCRTSNRTARRRRSETKHVRAQ